MDAPRSRDPVAPRFAFWILLALLGFGIWMQFTHQRGTESRLDALQTAVIGNEAQQRTLRGELGEVRESLGSLLAGQDDLGAGLGALETGLVAVREEAAYARVLAERLDRTEGAIGTIGEAVEAQAGSLRHLEEAQASFAPSDIVAELEERDARLSVQYENLNELATRAEAKADESNRLVEALGAEVRSPRDLQKMWQELVGPVVQLAGETSVGSGVLLQSRFDADRDTYFTYLITAWHVVRDIQGDPSQRTAVVPVAIYAEDGTIRHEDGILVCFDPGIDAALLEVLTEDRLQNGARIPRREDLATVRIFDEVYAVGCPLGNDPIPTRGEISTCHHIVDNERYWMINAPTYIGNSGGGIFHSETHELLGIFSKIYTHGSVRPTIVPHMGLVTPLDTIYEWLATEGYDVVEPATGEDPAYIAAADR